MNRVNFHNSHVMFEVCTVWVKSWCCVPKDSRLC